MSGGMSFRDDDRLVQGLKKITDYRAVHPMVWYIFREIYDTDGAPDICRWSPDLYSEPVETFRRRKHDEDSHKQAVYQLRQFLSRVEDAPPTPSANTP
ncbi:unnamed protein product [Laminaria digitata]